MATVFSKTRIANLALSHIRNKSVIENVDTESSTEAQSAKLWYDVARQQVLTDSDWGFARKRLILAEHGDDPPAEWAYRYQYPVDCVQPRRIENPLGRQKAPVAFELGFSDNGTQSILANEADATLIYTRDVEDTSLFTTYFILALSYILAYYLAGPLTGKKSIQEDMLKLYGTMLGIGEARDANATAAATDAPPDAEWIAER